MKIISRIFGIFRGNSSKLDRLHEKVDYIQTMVNQIVDQQVLQARMFTGVHEALKQFDERKAGTHKTIARIKKLMMF